MLIAPLIPIIWKLKAAFAAKNAAGHQGKLAKEIKKEVGREALKELRNDDLDKKKDDDSKS